MELTKKNGAKIYVNVDNVLYTQNQYLNFQSGTLLEVTDVDKLEFNNSAKYKNGFVNMDKVESFEKYGAKTEVLFLTGDVISFEDFEVIKYLSRPTDFVDSEISPELTERFKRSITNSKEASFVPDKEVAEQVETEQEDVVKIENAKTEITESKPVKPKTTRKRTKA
jgi:pyruvate carboxylase